jgi:hypothetical protein
MTPETGWSREGQDSAEAEEDVQPSDLEDPDRRRNFGHHSAATPHRSSGTPHRLAAVAHQLLTSMTPRTRIVSSKSAVRVACQACLNGGLGSDRPGEPEPDAILTGRLTNPRTPVRNGLARRHERVWALHCDGSTDDCCSKTRLLLERPPLQSAARSCARNFSGLAVDPEGCFVALSGGFARGSCPGAERTA